MTNKLALVVAVVLGVLSIVGIRLYVDKLEKQHQIRQNLIDVFVASRDLAPGRALTREDVEIGQFPAAFIDAAFRKTNITDINTIVGERTVESVVAGQVLQQYHFQKRTTRRFTFDKEYRAITIPMNRVGGVGGLLRPADQVDVLVNMPLSDQTGASLAVTRALFRNVLVLALDTNTDPFMDFGGYATVTLRLRPEDCNKLAFSLYNGASIHLTYVQPGTPEPTGYDSTVADHLWQDIKGELSPTNRPR
ncbi:MAG: Flp pilus assembly protein CpaB [Planctomycetota bacterium]|nr:Flp pilus assembly protein CpaB [Planctomycetota bacterium]